MSFRTFSAGFYFLDWYSDIENQVAVKKDFKLNLFNDLWGRKSLDKVLTDLLDDWESLYRPV